VLYLKLFWEFFKTGLFAIGGGMATLPFLSAIGETTKWFSSLQLANMVAVSESTPGPLGINMATYVGYTVSHAAGAIVATLSEVLPSIIIISIVAAVLQKFKNNQYIQDGFYGLRAASTGLIAAACFSVAKVAILKMNFHVHAKNLLTLMKWINWKALLFAFILLVFTNWIPKTKRWHPIVFIAISAFVGIIWKF
jgi:chromate transporter